MAARTDKRLFVPIIRGCFRSRGSIPGRHSSSGFECARAESCEKKELGMLCCFSTVYYLKECKQYKSDGLANVSTVNTSSGTHEEDSFPCNGLLC
ncbi:hypothetical protein HanHA89_Chr06g0229911 [Helianthus annuus]|nr:hypothetical protein HanHA89_Chr06g0229911 [Helianthus annuus]